MAEDYKTLQPSIEHNGPGHSPEVLCSETEQNFGLPVLVGVAI
jgi:hypothetical protein